MTDYYASTRKRKEFRQSREQPEVPKHKKKSKKGNAKKNARWCHRKVGVEHKVVINPYYYTARAICSECGMDEWRLPIEALAQVYPRAKTYLEYRDLCKEYGHQWESVDTGTWWRGTIKHCTICNYTPKMLSWAPLDKY